jgi:hypothetical protein
VISIFWGDEARLPIDRLKASLKKYHPELPHEIIRVDAPSDDAHSLNRKTEMMDLSPFDQTLFLDLDTVVMGNLEFGFQQAERFGIAMSICESPWARRYANIFQADEVEYNTGVIFFTKKSSAVFENWKELSCKIDSSHVGVSDGKVYKMPANDQGSFALSMMKAEFNPFILPLNWNFRPMWHRSFFGPIKIWHDYSNPPPFFEEMNDYYLGKDSIIQYHQG